MIPSGDGLIESDSAMDERSLFLDSHLNSHSAFVPLHFHFNGRRLAPVSRYSRNGSLEFKEPALSLRPGEERSVADPIAPRPFIACADRKLHFSHGIRGQEAAHISSRPSLREDPLATRGPSRPGRALPTDEH